MYDAGLTCCHWAGLRNHTGCQGTETVISGTGEPVDILLLRWRRNLAQLSEIQRVLVTNANTVNIQADNESSILNNIFVLNSINFWPKQCRTAKRYFPFNLRRHWVTWNNNIFIGPITILRTPNLWRIIVTWIWWCRCPLPWPPPVWSRLLGSSIRRQWPG